MIEAFSYMFKDNKFVQKATVYFIFLFIGNFFAQYTQIIAPQAGQLNNMSQFLICILFAFLIGLIPVGYSYLCVKALMVQKDNYVLPFLNVWKCFVLGLKFMINMIALLFLFYSPFIVLAIIGFVLGMLGGKTAFAIAFVLIFMLYLIFSIAYLLLILIYTPVFNCIFSKKEWLTSFCRFIKATKLIKQDAGRYFTGIGVYVLTLIVYMIIYGVFSFTVNIVLGTTITSALLISLFTAILSSYLVFVYSYIVVAAVKHEMIE